MNKYRQYLDQHVNDLSNKVVVITGANSGLGFQASRHVLYKQASLVMACRSIDKAEQAKIKLLNEYPNANIDIIAYNQASFTAIDQFVETLKSKYETIDVLICNAGVYRQQNKVDQVTGLSLTMQTNFIGLYYLMRQISPYLSHGLQTARVIFVTSLASYKLPPMNWADLINHKFSLYKQYSYSKWATNKLFHALQYGLNLFEFPERKNIHYYLMHPGVTLTNITQNFRPFIKKAANVVLPIFVHHSDKASLSMALLAGGDHKINGSFYVPRGLFEISGYPIKKKVPSSFSKGSGQFLYDVAQFVKHHYDQLK